LSFLLPALNPLGPPLLKNMSTPILLTGPSATGSFLANCKDGMDVAKARGYAGVRFSAGLGGYGNNATVDTSFLVQAVQYAQSIGLGKVSILLNVAPNPNGTMIVSLNGGVPLPVPHLPSAAGVLDWIVRGWQDFVDAARAVAPDSFLEWEWLNEGDRGGNQQPADANGSFTTYSSLLDGEYPAQTATTLDYISSRVNFHSCNTIALTLEGSGTTSATREVNSISGSTWTSVINRATHIGTNCYSAAPATPYDAAATKAAFSAKLGAQLTRMSSNSVIGSKPVKLREFGLDYQRKPPCQIANAIRNDIVAQVTAETGITDGGFYCAFDTTGNMAQGQAFWFKTYNLDKTPIDGVAVGP
jgi:hypothetical protein